MQENIKNVPKKKRKKKRQSSILTTVFYKNSQQLNFQRHKLLHYG